MSSGMNVYTCSSLVLAAIETLTAMRTRLATIDRVLEELNSFEQNNATSAPAGATTIALHLVS